MAKAENKRYLIRKFKKGEEPDDVLFWLSQSPLERIYALEDIRKAYNNWKYGPQQGFKRVYSVTKRQ